MTWKEFKAAVDARVGDDEVVTLISYAQDHGGHDRELQFGRLRAGFFVVDDETESLMDLIESLEARADVTTVLHES